MQINSVINGKVWNHIKIKNKKNLYDFLQKYWVIKFKKIFIDYNKINLNCILNVVLLTMFQVYLWITHVCEF